MVYPERKNVIFHTGLDNLTEYRFGNKLAAHRFCKTCGSTVYGEIKTETMDMMPVNVNTTPLIPKYLQ